MCKLRLLAVVGGLAALVLARTALADSIHTNFEPPAFHTGSPNGQDGWTMTGSYDAAIVADGSAPRSFGTQSLRISDAVTSGAFGDQLFARPLVDSVGETAATAATFSVGTRYRHFEMQFDIVSTRAVQQPGMHLAVSPDRGDGSSMSHLRFEDGTAGIDVFFDDVEGTSNPANFVETEIATGLKRTTPHTIQLTLDTLDGPSNDVVKVSIDGSLVETGTSWENYYWFDSETAAEQTPRIVKTVLLRETGTASPADLGAGFLIDNFSMLAGPIPGPTNWAQCTNGGWQTFVAPSFRNQDQCLKAVDKNPSGGGTQHHGRPD